MGNLFIGFPVPRARIAEMIEGAAPPLEHIDNHLPPGSDPLVLPGDISTGQLVSWNGTKFVGVASPAGGIANRYADNNIFLYTNFESLDGFTTAVTGSGAITLDGDSVDLYTDVTAGSTCLLNKNHTVQFPLGTWNKARKFKAMFYFQSIGNETGHIYIGMGRAHNGRHVAFFVEDGVLQGSTHDGTTQTKVELDDWGAGAYAKTKYVEAIFTPASKAEFYIDGVKIDEITADLPSGGTDAEYWIFSYLANSGENYRNRAFCSQYQFMQDE